MSKLYLKDPFIGVERRLKAAGFSDHQHRARISPAFKNLLPALRNDKVPTNQLITALVDKILDPKFEGLRGGSARPGGPDQGLLESTIGQLEDELGLPYPEELLDSIQALNARQPILTPDHAQRISRLIQRNPELEHRFDTSLQAGPSQHPSPAQHDSALL